MNEKKLVRIEFEFSDGEIRYLEGEDAVKWKEAADAQAILSWTHGDEFPPLNWKTKQK